MASVTTCSTVLHQSFIDIPQRQQCSVTLLEDTHHEFHSAPGLLSITTLISQLQYKQLSREEDLDERGRNERPREKSGERSEESNQRGPEGKKRCFENTGKTVEVCFSKNVTVGVITGDVSSLSEKVVNTVCERDNS